MSISFWILERVQRSNGTAVCDGVHLSTYTLPKLVGSAKQVAKARDIRSSAMFAIRREIEVRTRSQLTNGTHGPVEIFDVLNRSLAELSDLIWSYLERAQSAQWWVERESIVTNGTRGSEIIELLRQRAEGPLT
jgi:hypothetical protein